MVSQLILTGPSVPGVIPEYAQEVVVEEVFRVGFSGALIKYSGSMEQDLWRWDGGEARGRDIRLCRRPAAVPIPETSSTENEHTNNSKGV